MNARYGKEMLEQAGMERCITLMVSAYSKSVDSDNKYSMVDSSWIEKVHVEATGPESGVPVVLLHGWGSNAALMAPLANGLNTTFRVFNIDLPGHGETPNPPEPWGVPEFGEVVERIVREHVAGPAHFVGHSNGGRISLYLASEPDVAPLIKSLSLISPSGIRAKRSFKYHVKKGVATTLKAPFQVLPGGLREYGLDWVRHSLIWRQLGSSDYQQLSGVMRGTFVKTVNFYVEDRLNRIEVPTLLFRGSNDDAVSAHQMAVLEQHISDAALIELDGAGHYGYLDKPGIVIPAIRHFIEQQ